MDSRLSIANYVLHGGVAGKEDTPRGIIYQFCDMCHKERHFWQVYAGLFVAVATLPSFVAGQAVLHPT